MIQKVDNVPKEENLLLALDSSINAWIRLYF